MAEKLRIVICSGTACYVMGASDILLLEDELPDDIRDLVEVEGATCLGFCKDAKNGRAPFVIVGDQVMAGATLPAVIARIREMIDA